MKLMIGSFLVLGVLSGRPASAQVIVPSWWPCPTSGAASAEAMALVRQMLPDIEDADRRVGAAPGTGRAKMDKAACDAERNPALAAEMVTTMGYPPDWTKPERKRAAAISALAARGAQPAAAPQPAPAPVPVPAQGTQWFTYNQNRSACFQSRSPAQRIEDIQGAGHTATTEDFGPRGAPTKVEVTDEANNGSATIYTYWRSLQDCEAELPRNQAIAPRYR